MTSRPSVGSLFVLPSYLLAAVALTWPLAARFGWAIPSGHGAFDPAMQAFLLGWDWSAIRGNVLGIFDPPIFHPERNVLTYMDHLIGETVGALPVLELTGSIAAAYNFLVIGSFALSAWITYRLARSVGASRTGSYVAGLAFAFSPYRYANLDLLNQLQTQFLPLGLLFGVRYLERYRTRHLVGAFLTLAVQAYWGWYYACYLALAMALLGLYGWFSGALDRKRVRIRGLLTIAAVAFLAIPPVLIPYLRQRAVMPEFRRTLGESALYSADVLDYVTLHPDARVLDWMPLPSGGQSYFPGLVVVLLAIYAIRSRSALAGMPRYFAGLAAAGFAFSLGPILHFAGARIWIPLPYALLYFTFPGFSGLRAPARLAVIALLGLAVLAAVGYDSMRRKWKPGWRARLLPCGAIGLTLLFAWPRPVATIRLPAAGHSEPIYAWLAEQPAAEPILEFPVPAGAEEDETHSLRQYAVVLHGRPRLDGASGFVSARYKEFRVVMQDFPSPAALRLASEMGARVVIVHFGDYPPAERAALWRRLAGESRLEPLVRFGTDAAYRLRPGG